MDATTGRLYNSHADALDAGVDPANIVELSGPGDAVKAVSDTVAESHQERLQARAEAKAKARRRAANKRARKARRRNR